MTYETKKVQISVYLQNNGSTLLECIHQGIDAAGTYYNVQEQGLVERAQHAKHGYGQDASKQGCILLELEERHAWFRMQRNRNVPSCSVHITRYRQHRHVQDAQDQGCTLSWSAPHDMKNRCRSKDSHHARTCRTVEMPVTGTTSKDPSEMIQESKDFFIYMLRLIQHGHMWDELNHVSSLSQISEHYTALLAPTIGEGCINTGMYKHRICL